MINLARASRRPGFARSFLFVAAGSLAAMLVTIWTTLCGSTPVSLTALAISLTIGCVCCDWASSIIFASDEADESLLQNRFGLRSIRIGMFMAMLAMIWLTPLLMNVTLLAGCETFGASGTAVNLLALMFPGLIVSLNVVMCGLFLRSSKTDDGPAFSALAIAAAFGSLLVLVHSWISLPMAATVTTAFFLAAVFWELSSNSASRIHPESTESAGDRRELSVVIAMTVGSTVLLMAGMEILGRLIQINLPVIFLAAFWTSLIVGFVTHRMTLQLLGRQSVCLAAFAVLALLPWGFQVLVDMNLAITTGSGATMTIVWRSLQIAIICAAGIVPLAASSRPTHFRTPTYQMMAVLLGMILSFAAFGRGISTANLLTLGLMFHAVAALFDIGMNATSSSSSRRTLMLRRTAAIAPVALAFLPVIIPAADEFRASSLLFSPRTIAAMQRGLSRDLIEQSDANRLVEQLDSDSGHLSVWRRAGHVYEFQQDGIALGRVSADTNITPQPPEEILPAIVGLVSHPQPGRVLLLGDDTGVCLRTSTHFPVQEIVALRGSEIVTSLAKRYTWSHQTTPADQDERVRLLYLPPMLALRDRTLKSFDVIVAAMPQFAGTSTAFQYTSEFYQSVRDRLTTTGIFCQRLKQSDIGPQAVKQVMASLMEEFKHVGVIQTVPGELVLLATNSDAGLVDPQILTRLQRDHVKHEIATTGLDWSQVAILPLIDANDPIGLFSHEQRPRAISICNGGFSLSQPIDSVRHANKSDELKAAFGPHQVQLISSIPVNSDVKEAQRRLNSLQQQLEILAGMPDQPWTYRKSLRMEMQRDPRPPIELVKNGQIVKQAHPLDELRKEYFVSLGQALQMVAASAGTNTLGVDRTQIAATIEALTQFTEAAEPLMSHFAHYEIIRLHELAGLRSYSEELQHRLHIVFFTTPTDSSVRPVISALEQLVEHPELVSDEVERYDLLNSLVQKLIERWEARTAWEPKSALRVQNDVEKSVRVVNLAMDQMEKAASASHVPESDFLRRRRFITAALIAPLRDYRDQVLAHRMKKNPVLDSAPAEPNTEEASDLPLLINSDATSTGINTN